MPWGKCNRASRHYFETHLPFRTQQVCLLSQAVSGCPLCSIICDSIVQFTSSIQMSGLYRYKTSKTHECFKRTSTFDMKLIISILTVLVFLNAVYSAAMRDGSEDLLHFLNDAFQMNLPADNLEPTQITEAALQTEKILYPAYPTAECKAPETVNVAEFSNTTPRPNPVENTGIAEERSIESSNSDSGLTEITSAEDSRDAHTLQEQYKNSGESVSIDTTDMDTEVMKDTNKHPSKVTVLTDISSEEVDKPEENVRYRSLKTIENFSAPERQKLDLVKETHPIIQSLAGRTNLKDQSAQTHETVKQQQKTYKSAVDFDSPEIVDTPDRQIYDAASEEQFGGKVASRTVRIFSDQSNIKTPLRSNNQTNRTADKETFNPTLTKANLTLVDNSTEISGLNPCTEISVEENNSLDPSKLDQKIQKDTMSYENLIKICPGKRVATLKNQREQLDFDSSDRVSHA